jgi:pimeloyl-[acyl-carrier protein] methyl ester esterase
MRSPASVILLAGWAVAAQQLSPLAGHLAAAFGREPVLFDLHGVPAGLRPAEPSPYARALQAVLAGQPGPALLVGWSTGALIALETAYHRPDLVGALVLLSGTACFCTRPDQPYGVPPGPLRAMRRALTGPDATRVLRNFFHQTAAPGHWPENRIATLCTEAMALGRPALVAGLDYLAQTDGRPWLPVIHQPVLALHGGRDALIPCTAAQAACAQLPAARLIVEPDQGHALPLDRPQMVSDQVAAFWKQRP